MLDKRYSNGFARLKLSAEKDSLFGFGRGRLGPWEHQETSGRALAHRELACSPSAGHQRDTHLPSPGLLSR